jgi:hypothetical protein
MILSTFTQLQKEVGAVADKIYKVFKTSSLYRGFEAPTTAEIKVILFSYIKLLKSGDIKPFTASDGKRASNVVKKVMEDTRYVKDKVFFTLYELEKLAQGGMITAQRLLNYDKVGEDKDLTDVLFPEKSGFLGDIKQVLLYALIILAFIYFAPFISQILKQISKRE